MAAFFLVAGGVPAACGQSMTATPDQRPAVYAVGETARWSVRWSGTGAPPATHYTLKTGGRTLAQEGDLSFANNLAEVSWSFTASGTVLLEITWQPTNDANHAWGGAVAAPDEIQPAADEPADFDAFWAAKLAELAAVPVNPVLQSVASGRTGVNYWKIAMDNIRSTHIQGQIARPQTGAKFPALLIVQWAGVYGLDKSWVTNFAADGWLALNLNAHDLPIDETAAFYQAQSNGPLANYWMIGNEDRDTSYYLRMYLSCYRAVEYLKSRADWDGKTIVVTGASQGGQQALMTAGLHPDITGLVTLVPAACDMLAPVLGRAAGFPNWYDQTWGGRDPQRVREASRYYDPVNFAARIRCPALIALGLFDTAAPPSSIFAALNRMRSPREVLIMDSGHQNENGSQDPYSQRAYGVWFPTLRAGGQVEIPGFPQIARGPQPLTLAPGQRLTLWVESGGGAPVRYQWLKDGVPMAGATSRFLEIAAASADDAGRYSVEVSNSAGTIVSGVASVALDATASARLANLSVRGPLAAGTTLIPGFVLGGGSSRELVLRAVGPTLADYDVANPLADPALTLYAGQSSLLTNDDWGAATNADAIATTTATLGGFALGAGSRDAAALVELAPALYTTHVTSMGGSTGIALFELYEGAGSDTRLLNVSARADIGAGENIMIPGFALAGTGAKTLLIRAVGPSLQNHGVTGWLENPVLTIFQGTTPILTNDDWGQAPDVAALIAASDAVHAFPLNDGSADAAVLVSLMPGTYTAQASGVGGTTGNVLVEVYEMP